MAMTRPGRKLWGIELTGIKELDRALRKLGERTEKQLQQRTLRKAANVIVKAAKEKCPTRKRKETYITRSGRERTRSIGLRKSIIARIRRYPLRWVAIIGPKWPEGAHGHLIEKGTKDRFHKAGVGVRRYVGKLLPKPFLRPAYDENIRKVRGIMGIELGRLIEKEATKLGKGR